MKMQIRRPFLALALGFAPAVVTAVSLPAGAQAGAEENITYVAVVNGNDVYVRCGAAESYYPFTKLNAGDLVKVTGEKFGWARVVTSGPAFNSAFGYVKLTKGDQSRFRMKGDGRSGLTLGRVDVVAPNLDAKYNPRDSWKPVLRLEADQTLRVLETIESDKDTIYKVALPDTCQGWISAGYLDPASDAQTQRFNQALVAHAAPQAAAGASAASNASASSDGRASAPAKSSAVHANKPIPGSPSAPAQVMPAPMSPAPAAATSAASKPGAHGNPATTDPAAPVQAGAVIGHPSANAAQPGASSGVTPSATTGANPADLQRKTPPTLEELEGAYKIMQKLPTQASEVGQLRELYQDLIRRQGDDSKVKRVAAGRVEQLTILLDIQERRARLEQIRARMRMSAEEADAVRLALERSAEYTAVGRIAASTIYDGESLPKLLRIQDPASGRTVAYLKPDSKFELVNRLDTMVGIIGEKMYDDVLRLNVIKPSRIDVLLPDGKPSPESGAPPMQQAGAHGRGDTDSPGK